MHRVIFLVVLGFPAMAFAQSLHQEAEGKRLEIGMPCAKMVNVVADPALSGRVVLEATAAHPEELSQMVFSGGQAVQLQLRGLFGMARRHLLSLHGDCWRPGLVGDFEPTLQVTLRVPAGFALAVDASGAGAYHLAAGGTLDLDSSGSAQIEATALMGLNLDMSGSGRMTALQVSGPIHADMSGSGDVAIAQASSQDVSVEQSGSSAFRIGSGTVGTLAIDSSGSGQVIVQGVVRDAEVDASGSGDVTIATITGRLAQNTSGSGQVRVGTRQEEHTGDVE